MCFHNLFENTRSRKSLHSTVRVLSKLRFFSNFFIESVLSKLWQMCNPLSAENKCIRWPWIATNAIDEHLSTSVYSFHFINVRSQNLCKMLEEFTISRFWPLRVFDLSPICMIDVVVAKQLKQCRRCTVGTYTPLMVSTLSWSIFSCTGRSVIVSLLIFFL